MRLLPFKIFSSPDWLTSMQVGDCNARLSLWHGQLPSGCCWLQVTSCTAQLHPGDVSLKLFYSGTVRPSSAVSPWYWKVAMKAGCCSTRCTRLTLRLNHPDRIQLTSSQNVRVQCQLLFDHVFIYFLDKCWPDLNFFICYHVLECECGIVRCDQFSVN